MQLQLEFEDEFYILCYLNDHCKKNTFLRFVITTFFLLSNQLKSFI